MERERQIEIGDRGKDHNERSPTPKQVTSVSNLRSDMSVSDFLSDYSVPSIMEIYTRLKIPYIQKIKKGKLISLAVSRGVKVEHIQSILNVGIPIKPMAPSYVRNRGGMDESLVVEITIPQRGASQSPTISSPGGSFSASPPPHQEDAQRGEQAIIFDIDDHPGLVYPTDAIISELGTLREKIYGTREGTTRLIPHVFDISPDSGRRERSSTSKSESCPEEKEGLSGEKLSISTSPASSDVSPSVFDPSPRDGKLSPTTTDESPRLSDSVTSLMTHGVGKHEEKTHPAVGGHLSPSLSFHLATSVDETSIYENSELVPEQATVVGDDCSLVVRENELVLTHTGTLMKFLSSIHNDTYRENSLFMKAVVSNPYFLSPLGILSSHLKVQGALLRDMETRTRELDRIYPQRVEYINSCMGTIFQRGDRMSRGEQISTMIMWAALSGINLRCGAAESSIAALDRCVTDAILKLRGKGGLIPDLNYHLYTLIHVLKWKPTVRKCLGSNGSLKFYIVTGDVQQRDQKNDSSDGKEQGQTQRYEEGYGHQSPQAAGKTRVVPEYFMHRIGRYVLSALLMSNGYEYAIPHLQGSKIITAFTDGLGRVDAYRIKRVNFLKIHGKRLSSLYREAGRDIEKVNSGEEQPLKIEEHMYSRFMLGMSGESLAPKVGMIIPERITDTDGYYEDNIADYVSVAERGRLELILPGSSSLSYRDIYSQYKDGEIFQSLGANIPYEGRRDLINRACAMATGGTCFFIPGNVSSTSCKNKETTLKENPTEIEDYIAWGTLTSYFIYSCTELEGAFKAEYGSFINPQEKGKPWSRDEVGTLLKLEGVPDELVDVIRASLQERVQATREIIPSSPALRKLLTSILHIGMYVRGWGGSGPYPLQSYAVADPSVSGEKCTEEMLSIVSTLDSMTAGEKKDVGDLKVVTLVDTQERKGDQTIFSKESILDLIDMLRTGSCSKDVALKIIRSTHYHINHIFKESLFDITLLK